MPFIVRIIVAALGVWVAIQLVDGLRFSGDLVALLAIAAILAVVNAVARPILTLLSLPLVLLTLGLFLLVINALTLSFTIWISDQLGLGLSSAGFGSTFLGALIVTIVSWVASAVLDGD